MSPQSTRMTQRSAQPDRDIARENVLAGVREILPAVPPNITFGLLFGATAVEVGFSPAQATAMSLLLFAGTAQMAAVELIRGDAAIPVVLGTVLVLNLRYSIYSASLAPHVRSLSLRWRGLMGYALSDVNYALAQFTFSESEGADSLHKGWYYVGVTLPFVVTFVGATLIGGLLGVSVGDALDIGFAIPLIFIALVVPSITDKTTLYIAGTAALAAVLFVNLPYNIGLLVATGCGVAIGIIYRNGGTLDDE